MTSSTKRNSMDGINGLENHNGDVTAIES